jgi:hypothetical protein
VPRHQLASAIEHDEPTSMTTSAFGSRPLRERVAAHVGGVAPAYRRRALWALMLPAVIVEPIDRHAAGGGSRGALRAAEREFEVRPAGEMTEPFVDSSRVLTRLHLPPGRQPCKAWSAKCRFDGDLRDQIKPTGERAWPSGRV